MGWFKGLNRWRAPERRSAQAALSAGLAQAEADLRACDAALDHAGRSLAEALMNMDSQARRLDALMEINLGLVDILATDGGWELDELKSRLRDALPPKVWTDPMMTDQVERWLLAIAGGDDASPASRRAALRAISGGLDTPREPGRSPEAQTPRRR